MGKRTKINVQDILYPDRILSNMINDYIAGNLDSEDLIYSVLVVKIDHEGRKITK